MSELQDDSPSGPYPEEDEESLEEESTCPILVLQPGSKWLRLGLASTSPSLSSSDTPGVPLVSSLPKTVLHAVARRRTKAGVTDRKLQRRDPALVPVAKPDPVAHRKLVEVRTRVGKMLGNTLTSSGRKRFVEAQNVVSQINAEKKARKIANGGNSHIPVSDIKAASLYGNDVLKLTPDSPYNIHFPIKRGDLDLCPGKVAGSESSILTDLEDIWTNAIESELGIPKQEFGRYRVVLVIPAVYRRTLIKHYMTLLLFNMGFGGAFVTLDHVCAAFGAGLSHCCVVDVGDQKTSVSCVEDGISLPQTRIHLDYGGSDITQVFHFLLKQSNFPFKDCQPMIRYEDATVLERLKTDNCHMDLDICGTAEKSFVINKNGYQVQHSVCLSDECVMAPMAFFHTELLDVTSSGHLAAPPPQRARMMPDKNEGDPEDPHDDLVDTVTNRKLIKPGDSMVQTEDEGEVSVDVSSDVPPPPSLLFTQHLQTSKSMSPNTSLNAGNDTSVIPLDLAILRSVEQCPSEDLKRRTLGSVLVVGQGFKFPGAAAYLKQRLALQMPAICGIGISLADTPGSAHGVEVIVDAKDLGSELTTWKGAAVMASLQSAGELWIQPEEWHKGGMKLLREKSPFPWT